MKKPKNIFKVIYLTLIVISLMASLSCDFRTEYTIFEKKASPDNKYVVYVSSKDVGATSGFNTQVSLLRSRENCKKRAGNIFICDSNHGTVDSSLEYIKGGPMLVINWISNKNLEIHYPKGTRIFRKRENIFNINIEYYEY